MKVLIIRFSSIGDFTQALSIPAFLRQHFPQAELHLVTRSDLAGLAQNNPHLKKVWTLDRKKGLTALIDLIRWLRKENFSHIYDAHNNLRSFLIRWLVPAKHRLVRPMMRWKRFLLLKFHINLFEKPFSGQRDLLKPLEHWGIQLRQLPEAPQLFLSSTEREKAKTLISQKSLQQFVVLVPSAAYPLKRWPIEYWKELIQLNPQLEFVVLAGPQDLFTADLNQYPNVLNLTGKTGLLESAAVIELSSLVVTNDTGLLHFAEQLGIPAIALMGPAPFGFPSRQSTKILERDLKCRPCSKHGQGPCTNSEFQLCLRSITPNEVSHVMQEILL